MGEPTYVATCLPLDFKLYKVVSALARDYHFFINCNSSLFFNLILSPIRHMNGQQSFEQLSVVEYA